MTSNPAPPPVSPSAHPRRRWAWAVLVLVACAVVGVGKNRLASWGVKRALRSLDVPVCFESLDVALMRGDLTVVGLAWNSCDCAEEDGMTARTDTFRIRQARWSEGRLEVQGLDLGNVSMTGTWNAPSDSLTPHQSRTASSWPASLKLVSLDLVGWKSLAWSHDSTAAAASSGSLAELLVGPKRVELGSMNLSGAWGKSPLMPDTVILGPSHLHGRWSPESWHVQSKGLDLPGLRFEGALSWPEREGNGSAELTWDLLAPWAEALDVLSLFNELELNGGQTSATWNLKNASWNASLSGPDWLSAEASGTPYSWNASVHAQRIPATYQASLPCTQLTWQAQGTPAACSWSLVGDSSVRVTGTARTTDGWWEALPSSLPVADLSFDVELWGAWISTPAERLTAAVRHDDRRATTIDLAQPQAPLPWKLNGSWTAPAFAFQAEVQRVPTPSGDTLDLTAWGTTTLSADRHVLSWRTKASTSSVPDTVAWNGWASLDLSSWRSQVRGLGLALEATGKGSPGLWVQAAARAARRQRVVWPSLDAQAHLQADNALLSWFLPELHLLQDADFQWSSNSRGLGGQVNLPRWTWGELELDSTHVTLKGDQANLFANVVAETANEAQGAPELWALDLHADTSWHANLAVGLDNGNTVEWALEALPGESLGTPWTWTLHSGSLPLGSETFELAETPLVWTSPVARPLPPSWKLESKLGSVVFQSQEQANGVQALTFLGHFDDLSSVARNLHRDLHVGQVVASGAVEWNPHGTRDVLASLQCTATGLAFDAFAFPRADLSLSWRKGLVFVELGARNAETQTSLAADGAFQVSSMAFPRMNLDLSNLPVEWFSTWVDSTTAVLEGRMNAAIQVAGKWSNPRIQGTGNLDTLTAFVPSLGTSFSGRGGFQLNRDELVLNNFVVADEQGLQAPVFGALLHDGFEDWNLDVSVMEAPVGMKIMDLPATPNAPVFGSLYGGGTLDVFYWNDQITLTGDVVADAPSDFKISLVTEEDNGWGELVHFATPQIAKVDSTEKPSSNAATPELGVVLDLDIEARPGARVTLVIDEENNANIVGYTEGNIQLVLEDWDRMTLQGQLEVVEGQYDFALGSFLRKTFEARPGAVLRWDGDPYQGEMALDAVYRTRANVQPLLGSASNSGMRNENIDVVLHLNGPMLQPNIAFDLEAPRADRLVQEALASAITDESERTNQAIALLSLQEFLPQQFSTLELGSNGLQEYSIDMITSSLSRFLSRINEDIEVGVSYDPQNALSTTELTSQDALQLALKASFLEDKLEVEGSLGSNAVNQDALSEARLQNVRVLYHLDEEKGVQLTGFSESQTSATQSANTTSQGIGIRWHRAFNWEWPWRQDKESDE